MNLDRHPRATRTFSNTASMALAFASLVALAGVAIAVMTFEAGQIEGQTAQVADAALQSSYALGDLNAQLARLRVQVALGLQETPAQFSRRVPLRAQIDAWVREDIERLGTVLDPSVQTEWGAVAAQVEQERAAYEAAASFIAEGRPSSAADLLARTADRTTKAHQSLNALAAAAREAALHALAAQRQRASHTRWVASMTTGVLMLGMLAISGAAIARLRRQERQLSEYFARIEASNADLEAFAGRVAHDLKNALGPVVLATSVLRRAAADPARVLEIADVAERSSLRATSIVDALLTFSRASQALEPDEIGGLRSAVKNVLEELAPLAAQLGVNVEVNDLPDLNLRISPGLLHIVLANLCGNAVKYLEGRATRRVRISARADGTSCRIDVEDTGPGIPKEAQEEIFEPFFRLGSSRVPGTGIGLATVRRILDARGGRIAVESTEGRGARFMAWLPLAALPTPQEQPHEPTPQLIPRGA